MRNKRSSPTDAAGIFSIGGDLPVSRLGFGTAQLSGKGRWGEPGDRRGAIAVLRRVIELGVSFIDTADSYGPDVVEELIREALHPYPEGLVIATKGGMVRPGPDRWVPVGRPEYLRQCVELSLRRLKLERIDLYQLHGIDPLVPLEESLGELGRLQAEGKIHHIGLSDVSLDELSRSQNVVDVATVQHCYNLNEQTNEDVLDHCASQGIGFIPWCPLATGGLARPGGALDEVGRRVGAAPSQVALAWLLRRSSVVLPIPGTASLEHLEENCGALRVELSSDDWKRLTSHGQNRSSQEPPATLAPPAC